MKHTRKAVVICGVVLGVILVQAQSDAHVGTWKMNVAKSILAPDATTASQTRTYAMYGDGLKMTIEGVSADGSKTTGGYSAHFDGKDYPYTGSQIFDAIALRKIDANTFESTLKKSGKVVQATVNAVSEDGKVMTVTSNGTTAKGQKFTSVALLEKQ